jgi:hypothetical protein
MMDGPGPIGGFENIVSDSGVSGLAKPIESFGNNHSLPDCPEYLEGKSRFYLRKDQSTPRRDTHSVFVVDGKSGDVLEFNSDGELRKRHALDARLIAASEESGLWIANTKSIRRLNPKTLEEISQHDFETEAQPVGLAVR